MQVEIAKKISVQKDGSTEVKAIGDGILSFGERTFVLAENCELLGLATPNFAAERIEIRWTSMTCKKGPEGRGPKTFEYQFPQGRQGFVVSAKYQYPGIKSERKRNWLLVSIEQRGIAVF